MEILHVLSFILHQVIFRIKILKMIIKNILIISSPEAHTPMQNFCVKWNVLFNNISLCRMLLSYFFCYYYPSCEISKCREKMKKDIDMKNGKLIGNREVGMWHRVKNRVKDYHQTRSVGVLFSHTRAFWGEREFFSAFCKKKNTKIEKQ